MRREIYLIRDTALDAFLVPMFFQSRGAAMRAFADEVNRVDPQNTMNAHPEHFQMYYAGIYEDTRGIFESVPPEFVVDAQSVVLK